MLYCVISFTQFATTTTALHCPVVTSKCRVLSAADETFPFIGSEFCKAHPSNLLSFSAPPLTVCAHHLASLPHCGSQTKTPSAMSFALGIICTRRRPNASSSSSSSYHSRRRRLPPLHCSSETTLVVNHDSLSLSLSRGKRPEISVSMANYHYEEYVVCDEF